MIIGFLIAVILVLATGNVVQYFHNKAEKKRLKDSFRGEGEIVVANEVKTNGMDLKKVDKTNLHEAINELKIKREKFQDEISKITKRSGGNEVEKTSLEAEMTKEEDYDAAY